MIRYWSIARGLLLPRPSRLVVRPVARQWNSRRWNTSPPSLTPAAFALRDYQEECIQAVLEHHQKGHRRLGISLATGSGKTVIFTQLIERIEPLHKDATQTLILVHRRELVEQAASHCMNHYPDKTVEIEMGTRHASGAADITVASIQSISSGNRIDKFNPKKFKLILIDEAHHAVAKSYRNTLEHFGAMQSDCNVHLVGVSATFARSDGLRLGAVMDHIVYHKDFLSMIDSGWLSKVLFTTVKTDVKFDKVRTAGQNGDFMIGDLSGVMNTSQNNEVTVRSWMTKAGTRKSTLVFCVDVDHVVDMTNTFRRYGFEAFYVTGETPTKERAQTLQNFRDGKFPVLVNCGVYTEGTDIPNIDCVLLCRPTRSRTLLVQMIGRGMRLHPSKEDCHVIDVVGNVTQGVVTIPTLFGLPPEEVLDRTPSRIVQDKYKIVSGGRGSVDSSFGSGADADAAAEQPEPQKMDPSMYERLWNVTFVDYDSIHDLLSDTKGEGNVRKYSMNAWVWVSPGKFVLTTQNGGFLTIAQKDSNAEDGFGYSVTENRPWPRDVVVPGKKAPTMRPRVVIWHARTLEEAVHGADTFVEGRYPRNLILHGAQWRKGPASDGQLELLAKRSKKTVEEYRQEGLQKGKAMDMLTRLKHGATGLFKDLQARKRREARKEVSERKSSTPLMEEVKVGRLNPQT